jgi:hypothetical protein
LGAAPLARSGISILVALLAPVLMVTLGCDAAARGGSGDGGTGGTGQGGTGGNGGGPGPCHQALDAAAPYPGCGPTFADQSWTADVCVGFSPPTIKEQDCGAAYKRTFEVLGGHQVACYYEVGGRTLVGAEYSTDTTRFCNNTSAKLTAGEVPAAPTCTPATIVPRCPVDGGAAH